MSSFLSAAWGADTPTAPIWLMRQAGRYLPEYRKLKERYGFWRMCRTPEIAAEVTSSRCAGSRWTRPSCSTTS